MLLAGNESVREVKLFGLGETPLERYQTLLMRFYEEDREVAQKRTIAGLGRCWSLTDLPQPWMQRRNSRSSGGSAS
jgi:hypothetical protein